MSAVEYHALVTTAYRDRTTNYSEGMHVHIPHAFKTNQASHIKTKLYQAIRSGAEDGIYAYAKFYTNGVRALGLTSASRKNASPIYFNAGADKWESSSCYNFPMFSTFSAAVKVDVSKMYSYGNVDVITNVIVVGYSFTEEDLTISDEWNYTKAHRKEYLFDYADAQSEGVSIELVNAKGMKIEVGAGVILNHHSYMDDGIVNTDNKISISLTGLYRSVSYLRFAIPSYFSIAKKPTYRFFTPSTEQGRYKNEPITINVNLPPFGLIKTSEDLDNKEYIGSGLILNDSPQESIKVVLPDIEYSINGTRYEPKPNEEFTISKTDTILFYYPLLEKNQFITFEILIGGQRKLWKLSN